MDVQAGRCAWKTALNATNRLAENTAKTGDGKAIDAAADKTLWRCLLVSTQKLDAQCRLVRNTSVNVATCDSLAVGGYSYPRNRRYIADGQSIGVNVGSGASISGKPVSAPAAYRSARGTPLGKFLTPNSIGLARVFAHQHQGVKRIARLGRVWAVA